MNEERESRATTVLSTTTDTAFAMALLWAVPALAFVLMLARM